MVDVFISYPQKERALMLPLKRRLEALGLILFVDVDGRLDGSPTFPDALNQGVRAAKAVLGCWSPWALTRPWVLKECGFGLAENKLVATERETLTHADVPLEFFGVDRKPLTDFVEDQPHEGWAMTLSALATKMRLWADKRPGDPEAADAHTKADLLDKAAAAERAALGQSATAAAARPAASAAPAHSPAGLAWAAIEASLDKGHYRRFERTFETDPAAFLWVIEAEARAKALERWGAVDKNDPDAIAEAIRSGFFPALEQAAKAAMHHAVMARQAVQEQRAREAALERQRQEAAAEVARKAEEERLAKPRRAAEAAKAGRPLSERAFPVELPGVSGWPSPRMIAIPPGRFLMGAAKGEEGAQDREYPQHEVRIDYIFAMGQHAVTFAEWDAALAAGAKLLKPEDRGWGRGNRPVINVSWKDAQTYIAWLNHRLGIAAPSPRADGGGGAAAPGPYRLPSEAEWEYACRAGTNTPFSFGATISPAQANYDGNHTYGTGKKGEYRKKTMPVGSFLPANPFGLHEMHGNVWEWCEDCYADYGQTPADGTPNTTQGCAYRVFRGGSWYDIPQNLRSTSRSGDASTLRSDFIGFRLSRTL